MRILHIIAAYKPAIIYGGPTMSVAMLCEQLTNAGVSTHVFTTTANGAEELPVAVNTPVMVDGVSVTYYKRITKDHTHFSPALLKALWKNVRGFDAVHIHAWWNLVSVFSCMIAVAKGIPIVLSPRGTLSKYSFSNKNTGKKKLIHNILGKNLLAKCHMLVTSPREALSVKTATPLSITVLPNFVKLGNSINTENIIEPDKLKLLFFSRIEEKKGLDFLLDALQLITVPYHLTIAGDGDKHYIDKLKASVPAVLTEHITWAGFHNDDKFDLLRNHHLMILPSHDENFGNVVIESLGVGTAVLISENVGLADYVIKNKLGWVCQANANSVGQNINAISNQTNEMLSIRKTAPDLIRRDYTGDRLVQQYINFYNKITEHGRL